MKIGIITAMPEEFRAVAASLGAVSIMPLKTFRAGRHRSADHEVLLVEAGMGFDNASRATETLIAAERPDLLISTGFCGGIDPALQAGDVVVAKHIVIAAEGVLEEVPVQFSPAGPAFVAGQRVEGKQAVGGTFLSTSAITSKRALAARVPGHYPSPVVEMESAAVALVAAEQGIPLLAIRAVSDCADQELEFSLDEFCDPDMRRIRLCKVLLTILKRPHIIPQLMRLGRSSRTAAGSITAAFSRLFASL